MKWLNHVSSKGRQRLGEPEKGFVESIVVEPRVKRLLIDEPKKQRAGVDELSHLGRAGC